MPEVIDPLSGFARSPLAFAQEPEINNGRRAFPQTQILFAGSPFGAAQSIELGWHDTSLHPEAGAFALIGSSSGLDDLIGEIVQVTLADRSVFVYVLQSTDLPWPMSLARRAFAQIGRLSIESAQCQVVVVR